MKFIIRSIKRKLIIIAIIFVMLLGSSTVLFEGNSETNDWAEEDIKKMNDGYEADENMIPVNQEIPGAPGNVNITGTVGLPCPEGFTITSEFGPRKQPKPGASTNHKGIDIGLPKGTDIYSALDGTVVFAGYQNGYGNVVYVDHGNGMVTRYGHLDSISVSKGQSVSSGTTIAKSGNTGVSTGPHLHFEVRVNDTPVNPREYFDFSGYKTR